MRSIPEARSTFIGCGGTLLRITSPRSCRIWRTQAITMAMPLESINVTSRKSSTQIELDFVADNTHDILRAVVVDLAAQRDGQLLVLQKACEIHLFASR